MNVVITATLNVAFLRSELARRNWDGKRLALEADVDPATISRAMRGGRVLPSTVQKIAAALDANEPKAELVALVAG